MDQVVLGPDADPRVKSKIRSKIANLQVSELENPWAKTRLWNQNH
jgi:hypothetical protein